MRCARTLARPAMRGTVIATMITSPAIASAALGRNDGVGMSEWRSQGPNGLGFRGPRGRFARKTIQGAAVRWHRVGGLSVTLMAVAMMSNGLISAQTTFIRILSGIYAVCPSFP